MVHESVDDPVFYENRIRRVGRRRLSPQMLWRVKNSAALATCSQSYPVRLRRIVKAGGLRHPPVGGVPAPQYADAALSGGDPRVAT